MGKKVLIIGGVAGGASAAARLRRLDEKAEIIMFERDAHISFANCGLPYYIGETIKEREKLLVQTPEAMKARFYIDVRTHSEVVKLDTQAKKVTVRSREKGVYEEEYDVLILSPGAKPLKPDIPGINDSRIFTLRNIPDTDAIKDYVDKKGVHDAVVIGGGYIGVEMAENLKKRGLNVTLVEAAPHILAPFDADMAMMIEDELTQNGVHLILEDGVKAFRDSEHQIEVILNSDKRIRADMAILSIGVAPDTAFLKGSGIQLGPKGHIVTNERMETDVKGVYAVGDAVEVTDFVTGQKTAVPLAGPANKQGRIAADNIAGLNSEYKGTQGTSIIKAFWLTAAATGANEKMLQKMGMDYKAVYAHPVSHASYYPGALPMTLKLIFDRQGKVLGAQGIGFDGVDKRIDVIATIIRMKGTVEDLTELELSYAPPFSSAKDPVNMAGYVAQNVLAGKSKLIHWKDLEKEEPDKIILLDVRSEEEFANGHVEGAINIPVDVLRERMNELDRNKTIIIYCQVGLRGYIADRILTQNGMNVRNITGGYKTYAAGYSDRNIVASERDNHTRRVTVDPDTQAVKKEEHRENDYDRVLDACGLFCPGPLMQVKAAMDEMSEGEVLKVSASDPGFYEDIKAWSKRTGNDLIDITKSGSYITAVIKKQTESKKERGRVSDCPEKDNKTLVVFSGELDKAIAAFIIANGAAAMNKKVTLFFTFWGLNILRKPEKIRADKAWMDRMFGMMMPRGSKKLKLSRMNMMGMGGKMIRKVMKNKNILSLEDLIQSAIDNGVEIVACQMSMDVMGLTKEELIDGVKIGGVGYYLGEAEDANVNLFI